MTELIGVPIPSLDWKAQNLPEVFRKFKQTCEFIFSGPLAEKSEEVKVQYLMLWVGEEGRDIREGWNLSAGDKKKLSVHWEKFESYTRPKSNFRVARFQLHELKQEQTEPIDAFMTRARLIASQCEYTDTNSINEHLLDTMIAGVYNDTIKRKLISKEKDLTLDQALKIVRAHETTSTQMKTITDTRKVHSLQAAQGNRHKRNQRPTPKPSTKPPGPPLPKGKCWNCGNNHARDTKCPAASSVCNYCSKKGHWEKVCIAKQKDMKSSWKSQGARPKTNTTTGKHGNDKKVHIVHEEDTENLQDDLESFSFDSIEVEDTMTNNGQPDFRSDHRNSLQRRPERPSFCQSEIKVEGFIQVTEVQARHRCAIRCNASTSFQTAIP